MVQVGSAQPQLVVGCEARRGGFPHRLHVHFGTVPAADKAPLGAVFVRVKPRLWLTFALHPACGLQVWRCSSTGIRDVVPCWRCTKRTGAIAVCILGLATLWQSLRGVRTEVNAATAQCMSTWAYGVVASHIAGSPAMMNISRLFANWCQSLSLP